MFVPATRQPRRHRNPPETSDNTNAATTLTALMAGIQPVTDTHASEVELKQTSSRVVEPTIEPHCR